MAKIGYKIPYNNIPTDIGEIAVKGGSNIPGPSVSLGYVGFRTNDKHGINDNSFLAVNSTDSWKQGTGVINYYKSSSKELSTFFDDDVASIYSCPNFKKIIGFYGDGAQPDTTARKVFKQNTTYRLQVKLWDEGFLISINDKATDGTAGGKSWHLKSKTGKLPTSLIVGIQAGGGNGGDGRTNSGGGYTFRSGGAGGGAGACCFVVLDWIAAAKKVWNGSANFVVFDFYITPIDNWKKIAYPNDTSVTKCDCNCVAINLKDDFYSSSSNEDIKSKIIIGCGQSTGKNAQEYARTPGKAGIIKNYDLGDSNFGIESGKVYKNSELSKYGIHILNKHQVADNIENAGNGGGSNIGETGTGHNSAHCWIVPTNCNVDANQYANMASNIYLEQLVEKNGGTANSAQFGGTGGGGASNYAEGGNGGITNSNNSSKGSDGTLGSGGGGGFANGGAGGKGGLPYIFFCSNIDFSVTYLQYGSDIKLLANKKSGYDAAASGTYIAYLQKDGASGSEIVYIYPNSTSLPYPPGCDASNTLLYRSSGSGGWRSPVLMSNISLNTAYPTYADARENPNWYYDITFTKK